MDARGLVGLTLLLEGLAVVHNTEELVHLLQGDTLGLGDEEPDEGAHEEVEGTEHEEHAVSSLTHGVLHGKDSCGKRMPVSLRVYVKYTLYLGENLLRATMKLKSHWVAAPMETLRARRRAVGISETRIQQTGPQPNWKKLSSSQSLVVLQFAKGQQENLRSPEEDTGDGDISESRHALASDRRLNTTVDTNQVHDETLSSTGPQQTPATTERVGNEDEEDGASGNLDDTIHTSGQEAGLSTGDTEVLEDLRSVVVLFSRVSHHCFFFSRQSREQERERRESIRWR